MLGDMIKKERLAQKLSQTQLANKLRVTQGAISQWEHNITRPDMELLSELALVFNCSVDYLLGKSDTRVDDSLLDKISILEPDVLVKNGNVLDAYHAANLNPNADPEENELIAIYRNLNNIGQSALIGTARGLAANPDMKKGSKSDTETTA